MTDKITASEIMGEVRQALRTFRAFEGLEDVLKFLVDQEKYQKQLQDSIASLEQKHVELQANVEQATSKVDALSKVIAGHEDTVVAQTSAAEEAASIMIAKATNKALNIVAGAEEKVKALESTRDGIQKEIDALNRERNNITSSVNTLRASFEQEKKRVSQALGLN